VLELQKGVTEQVSETGGEQVRLPLMRRARMLADRYERLAPALKISFQHGAGACLSCGRFRLPLITSFLLSLRCGEMEGGNLQKWVLVLESGPRGRTVPRFVVRAHGEGGGAANLAEVWGAGMEWK